MDIVRQTLANNASLPLERRGGFFLLQGAEGIVTLRFYREGAVIFEGERVQRSFKYRPVLGFDRVVITNTSGADNDIELIVADGDVDIQVTDSIVIANTVANPVPIVFTDPVSVVVADVNVTNALLDVREKLGATFVDMVPVAIDDAGVQVVAASATRREVRIRNVGANPVALVTAAATAYADAAVLVQPGETWIEATAAACKLMGKCAAGLASTLNVQTVAV